MTPAPALQEFLTTLQQMPTSDWKYQLEKFQAITAWAIKQACTFSEGDRVVIAKDLNITQEESWGWMPYREALAVGQTGTVQRIDFNTHWGYWYAEVILDREWSVSKHAGEIVRHWRGPVGETPPGYAPPSQYNQEHYPEGKRGIFCIPVKYLARAPEDHP